MIRRKVLAALVGATVLLTIVQMTALYFYDIHDIEWLFTPTHILGGACVALFFGYVATGLNVRFNLVTCLALVLGVGIAWEILELIEHMAVLGVDTGSDLVADLFGGFIAWRYIRSISHT